MAFWVPVVVHIKFRCIPYNTIPNPNIIFSAVCSSTFPSVDAVNDFSNSDELQLANRTVALRENQQILQLNILQINILFAS